MHLSSRATTVPVKFQSDTNIGSDYRVRFYIFFILKLTGMLIAWNMFVDLWYYWKCLTKMFWGLIAFVNINVQLPVQSIYDMKCRLQFVCRCPITWQCQAISWHSDDYKFSMWSKFIRLMVIGSLVQQTSLRMATDISITSQAIPQHFEWELIHWGRVIHILINKLTIIGLDNGLLPGQRQAIFWTNAGVLLIGSLETNLNQNLYTNSWHFPESKFVYKWLTFSRRHFQIHFIEWKDMDFDSDFTDVYFQGSN